MVSVKSLLERIGNIHDKHKRSTHCSTIPVKSVVPWNILKMKTSTIRPEYACGIETFVRKKFLPSNLNITELTGGITSTAVL